MTKNSEMFWGLIMEPNKRYSQTVKKHFRITMAAQDVSSVNAASKAEPSQVLCSYDGRNYLMCTLMYPNIMQCPLDLHFNVGTEVSFATNGKGHIHLTGFTIDNDEEESVQEDQSTDEEVSEEEVVVEKKPKKSKKKKQDSSPEVPAKKAKLTNGFANEKVEEEEEDDPDFEAVEDEKEEEEEEDEEEEEIDDYLVDPTDSSSEDIDEYIEVDHPVKGRIKRRVFRKPFPLNPERTVTLPNGIRYEDVRTGTGPEFKAGSLVTIYFEGRLEKNNRLFDHCVRGTGFTFRLGVGQVIRGLDDGVQGMKVGGVRQIYCPPSAGYGVKGAPPKVPPNASLVFSVVIKPQPK